MRPDSVRPSFVPIVGSWHIFRQVFIFLQRFPLFEPAIYFLYILACTQITDNHVVHVPPQFTIVT